MKEFPRLLAEANSHPYLRIIPAADLQNCESAITLSKEGYVSIFGKNEGYSKDVRPTTWNAIEGIEMFDADFINTLETALKPIEKFRKKEGTWDLDTWSYADKPSKPDVAPPEAIVICFDLSWSMNDNPGNNWTREENTFTKFVEIRQVFEQTIARMKSYHLLSNYVGVVTFSSRDVARSVTELTQLSNLPAGFKEMMQTEDCHGMTALWDALEKAKKMLVAFKEQHPKAKLRIIALTDGDDNESLKKPSDLCKELYNAEIILDSVVIGPGDTTDLFKMSKHTGGYAFYPTTRVLLNQVYLLEPFLDISARPDIQRIPIVDYSKSTPKDADMKTSYEFPRCRPHPLEKGTYISL
ncbi:hypothetical protein BGZ60DRAFT_551658, partial [Tricladium varicosporioides]